MKRPNPWTHETELEFVIRRVLCHLLVDQVPDQGLTELCESLDEFREFYRLPAEQVQRLPAQKSISATLETRRERPEFHIDEE
ncbi:MAG: hypothetical protein KAV82_02775 [Phycisphaerae bacterium]|nr:hypothetical protein [Phycisphaerae bacterium]